MIPQFIILEFLIIKDLRNQDYYSNPQQLLVKIENIEIGKEINDYFSDNVKEKIVSTLETNTTQIIKKYQVSGIDYDIDVTPLSGKFRGRGVILSLKQVEN